MFARVRAVVCCLEVLNRNGVDPPEIPWFSNRRHRGRSGHMSENESSHMDPSTGGANETRPLDARFIGRYRVKRLLGSGGMGQVYLAHDPVLDREVAVKLIGGSVDDAGARRLLVQEARAAGRLRHPNIVTIFDAGEHEGSPYIAMEYVGGETLRVQINRRAPVSLAQRLRCGEGACAGLAHAHRANVVHLDVKPDNLMLDRDGVVKVLDFGIARVLQGESLQTQHMAGTLRYMSPEQANGGPIDRRSDVFSLGSSLFELLSYEAAYAGGPGAVARRIASGPVPRLATVVPGVDPRLDALIARAMAFDPQQRFDDLDELGQALGELRRELEPEESARRAAGFVAVSQPSSASPLSGLAPLPATDAFAGAHSKPPSSAWRGRTLAGAGMGVALVAGLGVWMAWPSRSAPEAPLESLVAPAETAASPRGTLSPGLSLTPSPPPAAGGAPAQPVPARVAPAPAALAESASARGVSPVALSADVPREEVWRRLAAGNRPGVLEILRGLEGRENPPRVAYEIVEAVRPAAQQARADAAALPVSRGSASFQSGDESLARSSQLMQGRQPVEALVSLWQALDLFAGATAEGRSAATPAAPVPASPAETVRATPSRPAPDVPKPAEEPPRAPAQISESENVLAALRRYHQAYTSLDAAAVRQMYPALDAAQLEQLRRSFDAVTAYEIDLRQPRVDVTGTNAVVRGLVIRRIVPKVGRPVTGEVDTEFRLQRDARGWLIVGVRANP
jgi:serine/threonine protein kinase